MYQKLVETSGYCSRFLPKSLLTCFRTDATTFSGYRLRGLGRTETSRWRVEIPLTTKPSTERIGSGDHRSRQNIRRGHPTTNRSIKRSHDKCDWLARDRDSCGGQDPWRLAICDFMERSKHERLRPRTMSIPIKANSYTQKHRYCPHGKTKDFVL